MTLVPSTPAADVIWRKGALAAGTWPSAFATWEDSGVTPFDRAQDAYGLALELDSAVSHFENAIVCVLLGLFTRAHCELWRARMTETRPSERALLLIEEEP